MASTAPDQLRVVLVGKTGHGKSATANSLLGLRRRFLPATSSMSCTKRCQAANNIVQSFNGASTDLLVVDTPGFFDTVQPDNTVMENTIKEEIFKMTLPGVHAFLVVLSITARFTEEEQRAVTLIENIFGTKGAAKHCIVVFTNRGRLNNRPLDSYINENETLRQFIETCGGRKCAIENNADPETLGTQVHELLQMIDDLVCANGEPGYTSAEHAKVQEERRKDQERLEDEAREKRRLEEEAIVQREKQKDEAIAQKIRDEVARFRELELQPLKQQLETLQPVKQQLEALQQEHKELRSTSVLTGEIRLFSHNTSSLPLSWVFCHGQALSRFEYQRLFIAIGVSFGDGDGETTFNVPDFRGRFPLGLDPVQNQVAGKNIGGSSTQTLTVDQMPAHQHDQGTLATASAGDHVHPIKDPGHNHGGSTDSRPGGAGGWNLKGNGNGVFEDQTHHAHTIPIGRTGISILSDGTHSHSICGITGSTGNGQSFSIMPPYQTVDFIIYTGK